MRLFVYNSIKISLLSTMLALASVSCSSNAGTTDNGSGTLTAKLVWNNTTTTVQSQAKATAKAAAGVATVRILVTGAGMSAMQKDFSAADGGGMVEGIPAGSNRTVKAQGLDANLQVTYQGEVDNITIQAGVTTDVGFIIMQPLVNPATETEPNDSIANANIISIGGGAFKGRLSCVDDVDYYEFISTGGAVEFSIRSEVALSFDETARVSILAQDGTTVLASTIVRGSDTAIPLILATNTKPGGRYYLRVDRVPSAATVLSKDYVITPSYSTKLYETEPNDALATASQIVVGNGPFEGQLSGITDVDYFSFVSTGGAVKLSMVSDGPPISGETVRCTILAADGLTVLASTTISGTDTLFPVEMGTATVAGSTYYLRVDKDPSATKVFTKSYVITPTYTTVGYESEPDNSLSTADELVLGATLYGQLYDVTDVDYYTFVSTGNSVTFKIVSDGANIIGEAVRASIIDQDGTTTLNWTVIKGSDVTLPITLGAVTKAGGRYYLRLDKDPSTPQVFTKAYIIRSN